MNPSSITVAAIILAAGRATRMRDHGHKLLAKFDGVPLIRRTVSIAMASRSSSVTVVTGYRRDDIENSIDGMGAHIVHNPNFSVGIGSSIVAGFSGSHVKSAAGAIIMLADMPKLETEHLNRLIAVFRENNGRSIVRAVSGSSPGHPVILPSTFYERVIALNGDFGARQIMDKSKGDTIEVDIGNAAIRDVDTPEAIIAAGGLLDQEASQTEL
ncbi:nucleotidyltransferase family protein [Phyllobacterium sp. YR531]|uniref:nucleotidyltransferase family protein n=1 Tax=Phyllobacterium sp. YR531 TaxID=1144343 RepID=UPI00026F5B11|nr:nucleotidyltransferase family protein [Phyllobacterium sp. YR531]EJN04993.1 putative MobA-like protein [Phyllobacterium sp. YR531]